MAKVLSRITSSEPQITKKFMLFGLVLTLACLVLFAGWWINRYVYAMPFEATQLNSAEQVDLNEKLRFLEPKRLDSSSKMRGESSASKVSLEPKPYREKAAQREIYLTEREVNALLAQDPEIAKRVAIDFSEDLVSVRMLVPVPAEFPVFGGKTLRVHVGLRLGYHQEKPIVAMTGVSWGGIPIPSAWWGDIKNINLVEEFAGNGGFWDQFAKGVENIRVQEGSLRIRLKA